LDRRLGGPHSRSGRGGEEKNSQPPPGIEPQNLVAIPTELSRLFRNPYIFSKPRNYVHLKEKDHLENLGIDGKVIFK
jgi:hypothetical protein